MENKSFYEVIHRLIQVPLYVVDKDEEFALFTSQSAPRKIQEIIEGNRKQVLKSIEPPMVSRLKDYSKMSYIGFQVHDDTVILGPFLEEEPNIETLTSLKKRLRLIGEDAIELDHLYSEFKVMSSVEIGFVHNLIQQMLHQTSEVIDYKTLIPDKVKNIPKTDLDKMFKEFEFVKKNYEVEDMYLKIVETGDIKKAHAFQTNEIMMNLPERALNDSLRNTKTRLTIMNTLCNRAAIRGGIDVQLGHQISTNLGIQIEALQSNFDGNKFIKDILVAYTEAVNNYAIKNYSKLVRNAIFYIRRHITSTVSLKEIAEYLFVSKEHLSRQFKQETSYTITKYINRTKIIEAKKLLKERVYSILDISTMLGFANSSHFSKVFKEYDGLTPKQYQNQY